MILVIMVDRNYFGSFLYAAASLFTTASFSRCFFFSLLLFSRSSGVGNSSEDSLGSRRSEGTIGDRRPEYLSPPLSTFTSNDRRRSVSRPPSPSNSSFHRNNVKKRQQSKGYRAVLRRLRLPAILHRSCR